MIYNNIFMLYVHILYVCNVYKYIIYIDDIYIIITHVYYVHT